MQEHTSKDQDFSKARRTSPIHVVETPRLANSSAEALRDVHMSLVRAEQNLFNLVQGNHAANGAHFNPAAYGFAAQAPYAGAYAAPGFAPGFAPTANLAATPGLAYGIPPAITPWGTAPHVGLTSWGPMGASLQGTTATIPQAAAILPGTLLANASAFAANRTPACDISDEGKQFVCQVDLPGLRADQVEVLCFERSVVINAYREFEGDLASVVQAERGTATQQRAITLPAEIQPGGTKASLSNGVLVIVLPKLNPTEGPRRIKVQG